LTEQNLEKINNDVSPSEELSSEAVWDILKFAEGYMGLGSILQSPINANRMDGLVNGLTGLDTALQSSIDNPEQLILYGHTLELQSQIYRQLLSYAGNMLSFDFTYVSSARHGNTDYSSNFYKHDLDEVRNFFDRFDYKKEFTNVTRQLLRNEVFYCVPRLDGEKIFLQELPRDFCRITGKGEYCFRFAFNFSYFDGRPESLVGFPAYFTETYDEIQANKPTKRRKSSSGKWVEIPVDVGFMFKLSMDTLNQIPIFSGLFRDLINQNLMRNLQKNSDMAAAQKLVIGQVGRIKDSQAKTGNNFDTDARLLGNFLAFMKNALGDSVKLAALPLEQVQPIIFPGDKGLYKDYLKTTLSSSGVNSNLIFADSENRPNAIETQLSLNVDEEMMASSVYPQAESFLEVFVNLFTKKYQFIFKFEGTDFFTNKKQRLDSVVSLMNYGFLLPQKVASALSMNPFDFYRQIDEGVASGFASKLAPLINKSQTSQQESGRPVMDDSELSDSGEETRASGANVTKGGTQ